MPYIDSLPWDKSSEMDVLDDETQYIQTFLVFVRYQCTLPIFATVFAPTCGSAVDKARYNLGRLARDNAFAMVVLRLDESTGTLYRCVDNRPNLGSDYIV